jgi:predicted RNA-binding protein with RPS1 domain
MARKILGVTTDDIATTDLPHTDFGYEGTEAEAFDAQPEGTDNTFSPQTGTEFSEPAAEGTNLQDIQTPDTSFSQTDPEIVINPLDDKSISQTDIESSESSAADDPNTSISQTGLENTENPATEQSSGELNLEITPISQTDSEIANPDAQMQDDQPVKPRKRANQSQSGDETASAPPARRRRARAEPILAIDEQRSVETHADKLRSDLLDLVESQKSRKILSGTIQGVERSSENSDISFAVIYHGEFKVIIPAEETVNPPADYRDRSPGDVMHYLVTKRLGAEIDYIVKGVDPKTGLAAASRLEAMSTKRRQYYFGTDRDSNNLIYDGLSAEARVVSVIRAGIFVDLFGLETYIPLRELSYQRWIDASAHFQPGQRVLVKVLTLDRSDRDNIRVSASVKQAGENPYAQALKKYTPGSRYVGTVSMVDTNGVFVSLDGGIDCLCSYPKRGRPPRGSRVTVRIIGVNNESNRIWGAITHMTTAR